MGIIHTAKKDVPHILYKKYAEVPNSPYNENKVGLGYLLLKYRMLPDI